MDRFQPGFIYEYGSPDKMNSIAHECSDAKHDYDKCFNEWFGKFLKGETRLPIECEQLFKKYQECIRPKIKDELRDLEETH